MRRETLIACLALATGASAQNYNGTPVAWAVGTNESSSKIVTEISNDLRPTSIDATTPGSTTTRFAVPYVKQSGSHERYVTIARNVTGQTINSYRNAGFRIEDVERIAEGRYTALFGKNSENPVTTSWFYNLSSSQVTSALGSTKRLLELDSVVINGERKFNGVTIDNAGANARAWGWLSNSTLSTIEAWAEDNNMRIIDLDPRGNGRYSAVFLRKNIADRTFIATGSWAKIEEALESRGCRIERLNKLEGLDHYGAILINNVNAQSARVADYLVPYAGRGQAGAYVANLDGTPIVNLRGERIFYPASAIKVLIHVAGLAAVPVDELETYRVNGYSLGYVASRMMKDSNNTMTWYMNDHFGTNYINQFGQDHLGITSNTWIKDHYGLTPPDGEWNAYATLKDMTNIYRNRSVLGSARLEKYRGWMLTQKNTDLYKDLSLSLKGILQMSNAEYDEWKSRVTYEFKAGNVWLNDTHHLHWVNVGRVSFPHRIGTLYSTKTYVFGHFVNDSIDGYLGSVVWGQSAGLVKEQMKASMLTYVR